MDTILAKEFLINTFNVDFMTPEQVDALATGLALFAKDKCKEQRNICSKLVSGWPNEILTESEIEERILNAPEPKFQ